jgi:predicted AlkP superfamily phosphohydrolase/phosphomutase
VLGGIKGNGLQRVAVLGLDGVPFSLLKQLMDWGVMPRMAAAASSGTFVPMRTDLPAISSVAWTSFMTGSSPGEHGIFGFTDLKPGEIALHLPSFDDIRRPAIWHELSSRRSVIVNLPFTYPARSLNGVLVSGFVAPIFERAVYPEHLMQKLRSLNYRIDVNVDKGRQNRRFLVTDLFETFNAHTHCMEDLLVSEFWDLFIGVITGTDRLHHFLFDAALNPGHPFHKDFLEYYRSIDAFVGKFMDLVGSTTRLVLLSDHGFTDLKIQIYLNSILRSLGYLSFRNPNAGTLENLSPDAKAFALDPTRIYINRKERFRHGLLGVTGAEEFKGRIKHQLENLRLKDIGIGPFEGLGDLDEHVFETVLTNEEVYSGENAHLGPDLVVVPRRGFDVKASLNVLSMTARDIFTGMHTHDDAFLLVNEKSMHGELDSVQIRDVMKLVREVLH